MPKLLFFSRVALICNACFIITFLMHYVPEMRNGVVPSTIIILGTVVSVALSTLLVVAYILLLIAGRLFALGVPRWLIIINFVFFVFQVILLAK